MLNIPKYIEKMKILQQNLLFFIENEDNEEENFLILIQALNDQKIQSNKHDLKALFKKKSSNFFLIQKFSKLSRATNELYYFYLKKI